MDKGTDMATPNVGEVLLADLSTHELALRAAQGFERLWRDIKADEALLVVAAKRMERMAMFDWAESHAEKTRRTSVLEIESDKPLLFWGAGQGRQRDTDRKAADVAMAALRRGIVR